MAAFEVADLSALEILDSRGRPTLAVTLRLADGTIARTGVPSGASTGSRQAVERRDGDPDRYEGKGVLGAVSAVNTEIRDLLRGRSWASLAEADQAMAICRQAGDWQFVSHRSGETEDHFIADLAVGTGCGRLKTGAPARGERVAKYNRLIEIAATASTLRYGVP